jgi:phosphoenolpyruvate synthase/pyruvate phosphate dikinase
VSKHHSYILSLKNITAQDESLVGDAAIQWSQLSQHQIQMAEGFVLTTNAFDDFITAADIVNHIAELLNKVSETDAAINTAVSEQIIHLITNANYPNILIQPILQAYRNLVGAGDRYVILQASQVIPADFQPITDHKPVQVKGEASLLLAIKQIWAEMFTPAALLLRKSKDYDGGISTGIMIQKVPAVEASGMACSNSLQDIVEINASYGLYNNKSAHDVYIYSATEDRTIEKNIVGQPTMLVHAGRVGVNQADTATVPVSVSWQNAQKLPDTAIINIGRVTKQAASILKSDVCVNFVYETGSLHIIYISKERVAKVQVDNLQNRVKKELKVIRTTAKKEPDIKQLAAEVHALVESAQTAEALSTTAQPEVLPLLTEVDQPWDKNTNSASRQAQLITNLYLDISELSTSVLSESDPYDALYFDGSALVNRNQTLPEKVTSNAQAAHLIESYTVDLDVLGKITHGRPLFYSLSDIQVDDLDGVERHLTLPQALQIELAAHKRARKEGNLKNLRLILPRVRSEAELIAIKQELANQGFQRTYTNQIWLEISMPSMLADLPQLDRHDVDGLWINLVKLAQHMVGRKQTIDRDLHSTIRLVVSALQQSKLGSMPIVFYVPANTAIWEQVFKQGLQPEGLCSYITLHKHIAEISELEQAHAINLRKRHVGRPTKSL